MDHDVEQFVRELNKTWVERRYDDLAAFFDTDVVLMVPGTGVLLAGVDRMVDSYRQFGALATVHSFEIESIDLSRHGSFVMAHLRFEIDYAIGSVRTREVGLEVYAVNMAGPVPKIAWRHQVPLGESGQ